MVSGLTLQRQCEVILHLTTVQACYSSKWTLLAGLQDHIGFIVQQLIIFAFHIPRFGRSPFVSHPVSQGALCQVPTGQERLVYQQCKAKHMLKHQFFYLLTRFCPSRQRQNASRLSRFCTKFCTPVFSFFFFFFFALIPLSNANKWRFACVKERVLFGFWCEIAMAATAWNATRPLVYQGRLSVSAGVAKGLLVRLEKSTTLVKI